MSKKSRHNRQRAVFLVELSKMTDEEVEALGMTMPASDPRYPAVFRENQRRLPRRLQGIRDNLVSSGLSEEQAKEMVEHAMSPETFNQFLDETGNREVFNRAVHESNNDEKLDQVIDAINESHASMN